jgi:hypothetical protein
MQSDKRPNVVIMFFHLGNSLIGEV